MNLRSPKPISKLLITFLLLCSITPIITYAAISGETLRRIVVIVLDNRALFDEAESKGIIIPAFIKKILQTGTLTNADFGLLTPAQPVTTTRSSGGSVRSSGGGGGGGSTPPPVVVPVVTPDTTAPSVSITTPTTGSTITGSSVSLTATASDNVGVAGVQFKLDGSNLGSEDTTPPYSISFDTTTTTNASHTLSAVARDAAGNTTTSLSVSVTVSNTVSVGEGGSCSNEPSGYTLIDDNPMDSIPQRGVRTPHGWIDDDHAASRLSVTTDSGAPVSPSNVAAGLFAQGDPGGSGPFYIYRPFSAGEQYKNMYVCMFVKHSAGFDNTNGNSGSKFFWPAGDQVGGAQTYTSFNGSGMDFAFIQQGSVDREMVGNLNNAAANVLSRRGSWVKYEFLIKANTSNNTADGGLDVWIDGVHTHQYTDVSWQMVSGRTWQSLAWNPTYGGGLNPVPQNQYEYVDDVMISGSNQ